ncbi:MAG: hypothetical protein L3J82_07295 [Planctomycetes bacterium]|nr:hypothetical protein [Planctomycetota bacterium]
MKILIIFILLSAPLFARDTGRFIRRANLVKEIRHGWDMAIGQAGPVDVSSIHKEALADDSTFFVAQHAGQLLLVQFDSSQADPTAWLMLDLDTKYSVTILTVADKRCVAIDVVTGESITRKVFALHEGNIKLADEYELSHKHELDDGKVIVSRSVEFKNTVQGWCMLRTTQQSHENKPIAGSTETVTEKVSWKDGQLQYTADIESRVSLSVLLQLSRKMELLQLNDTAIYYAKRANDRAAELKLSARDPRRLKAATTLMRLNARIEALILLENSK